MSEDPSAAGDPPPGDWPLVAVVWFQPAPDGHTAEEWLEETIQQQAAEPRMRQVVGMLAVPVTEQGMDLHLGPG